MVYLTNTAGWQSVQLPRFSDEEGAGDYALTITQPTANVQVTIPRLRVTEGRRYFDVSVRLLDEVTVGEYSYILTRGGVTVSKGLAVVGDYHQTRKQYNADYKVIQYGRN